MHKPVQNISGGLVVDPEWFIFGLPGRGKSVTGRLETLVRESGGTVIPVGPRDGHLSIDPFSIFKGVSK